MIKKLLSVIVVAALGVVVARKFREHSAESGAPLAAVPRPIPAETLGVPAEVAPQAEPQPPTPLQVEPEERHALRPSPVPRERPVWSPPAEGTSTGKHAVHEDDTTDEDNTDR